MAGPLVRSHQFGEAQERSVLRVLDWRNRLVEDLCDLFVAFTLDEAQDEDGLKVLRKLLKHRAELIQCLFMQDLLFRGVRAVRERFGKLGQRMPTFQTVEISH